MDICELFLVGEIEKVYFNNIVIELSNLNNFLFVIGNENLEKII